MVGQPDAVGGDHRDGGGRGDVKHVDAPTVEGLRVEVIQAGSEVNRRSVFIAQVNHEIQVNGFRALFDGDGGRGRGVSVPHAQVNRLDKVAVGFCRIHVVHGPLRGHVVGWAGSGDQCPVGVRAQHRGIG